MAKRIPKNFLNANPQGAVASYSYTDIADGSGVQIFYGAKASVNATPSNTYLLTSQTLRSNDLSVSRSAGSGLKTDTFNFDILFNLAKTIKGTAFVNVALAGQMGSGSGNMYANADIIHFDGSTETSIGSARSNDLALTTTKAVKNFLIPITLTQKRFKAGETLRLSMDLVSDDNGNSLSFAIMGIDPANRAESSFLDTASVQQPQQLILYIPFKLDVEPS